MTTYAHTKLADFIQDQLFGKVLLNQLKNSLRYVAEDILRNPSDNSDRIAYLSFNNGATHGGRIAFDNNAAKYLGANAAGTQLDVSGIDLSMGGTNIMVEGDRACFCGNTNFNLGATAFYASGGAGGASAPQNTHFVAPRAGSIVAASYSAYIHTAPATPTLTATLWKNSADLASFTADVVTAAGDRFERYSTYSIGTHTFVAGDALDIEYTRTSGSGTMGVYFFGLIEVRFTS